jgi:hypothetical protein
MNRSNKNISRLTVFRYDILSGDMSSQPLQKFFVSSVVLKFLQEHYRTKKFKNINMKTTKASRVLESVSSLLRFLSFKASS